MAPRCTPPALTASDSGCARMHCSQLLDEDPSHRLAIASLLAAWWVQGVGFSFVPDSFTGTMNGFVSTWASAGLAFHFLRTTRITRDLAPIPSAE